MLTYISWRLVMLCYVGGRELSSAISYCVGNLCWFYVCCIEVFMCYVGIYVICRPVFFSHFFLIFFVMSTHVCYVDPYVLCYDIRVMCVYVLCSCTCVNVDLHVILRPICCHTIYVLYRPTLTCNGSNVLHRPVH